jgi:hypothetical protein
VPPLARETVPPGAALLVAALAARLGADGLLFYVFLAGMAVGVACGLSALGRAVDAAQARGGAPGFQRLGVACSGIVVVAFFLGAAASSPVVTELGATAPGLAGATVVAGLAAVAAQVVAGLAGERDDDVRIEGGLLALDADAAQRPHLGSVR